MIEETKLKKSLKCQDHGIEKTFYCMDERCKRALCPECFILGHIDHKKRRVAEVYDESKLKLKTLIEPLERTSRELEAKILTINGRISDLEKNQPDY